MSDGSGRQGRRIVLGVGAADNPNPAVEIAGQFAAAFEQDLLCLMVEEDSLLNLSGLPFARAVGPGGITSSLSPAALMQHFNRTFREIERGLAAANFKWMVERPQGDVLAEIARVLGRGDTVVIDRGRLAGGPQPIVPALRHLLDIAAAVVLPARRQRSAGPVLLLGTGAARPVAERIARATGSRVEPVTVHELAVRRAGAAALVAELAAKDHEIDRDLGALLATFDVTTVVVAASGAS
jgi:hypothetical protein